MDPETRKFFVGVFFGSIASIVAWAALLFMVALIVDRVP